MKTALLGLAVAGALFSSPSARAQTKDAFSEFARICERDAGRLWGASLCGPLLIVEPSTRSVRASQADAEGVLHPEGDRWVGVLPPGVGIANTSVEWAGVRWIMVMAPLPDNASERRDRLVHEAWHRAQADVNLPAAASDCAHLETERGRYLLRLELRALRQAVLARGGVRRRAARDALRFRAVRLAEFAQSAEAEAALDRNEGLASYTGAKLGAAAPYLHAAAILQQYDQHRAFARAYAYASGPAYGLLLDQFRPGWRRQLASGDRATPAELLAQSLRLKADAAFPAAAAARYGGVEIAAQEQARALQQQARIEALRVRYAAGPRLVVPLTSVRMEFDPNQVTPIEGLGNHYGVLTLRDAWGELVSAEGALISGDFSSATVLDPGPDRRSGPGWSLQLAPGFQISTPGADGAVRVGPAQRE